MREWLVRLGYSDAPLQAQLAELMLSNLLVAIPIVIVLSMTSTDKTMSRGGYFTIQLLIIAIVVLGITLLPVMGDAYPTTGGLLAVVVALVATVLGILYTVWSGHRAQDIGWSKWTVIIVAIPLVGIVYWLFLVFKRGQTGDDDEL